MSHADLSNVYNLSYVTNPHGICKKELPGMCIYLHVLLNIVKYIIIPFLYLIMILMTLWKFYLYNYVYTYVYQIMCKEKG